MASVAASAGAAASSAVVGEARGAAWLLAGPALLLSLHRRGRTAAVALLFGLLVGARGSAPSSAPIDGGALRVPTAQVIEGTVRAADPPGPRGTTVLLDLAAVGAFDRLEPTDGGALLLLGAGRAPVLVPGDRVRTPAQVDRFASARNPGGHDAAVRWRRLGVTLRARVPDPSAVEVRGAASGPLAEIARARAATARALDQRLGPGDAGLARALVLGDRGAVDDSDRARFRASGQAHVVAVSGLHVTFLLGAWLWALSRVRVPARARGVAGIGAILFYVPFAGAAPSALRAGVGGVLYLGARLFGREASGVAVLAAVALALLAADPPVFFDAGFQLSFAAVLGILLLGTRLEKAFVPEVPVIPGVTREPRAWIRRTFAISTGAWLATAPFVLGHLGQACPSSPFVAVPILPLGALLLGTGLAVGLLGWVPVLGWLAATAFSACAGVVRWFLDVVVSLGLGMRTVDPPETGWHLAYLGAFLAATLGPACWLHRGTVAMVALLAVAVLPSSRAPPEHPRLVLLDVGRGQCAVLSLPDGRTALLDAGSQGDPAAATRTILPALRALRVRHLELVTLSHPDADHTGALAAVAREIPVASVVVGPAFRAEDVRRLGALSGRARTARRGEAVLEGAWGSLRVVAPSWPEGPASVGESSDNDASLVLLLETLAGRRVLFPGDVETAGVEALLRDARDRREDVRADVLVLPHHGLPGPGREILTAAVRPTLSLASCARADAAGLPAGTLSTAESGAIFVALGPSGPTVTTPFAPRPAAPSRTLSAPDVGDGDGDKDGYDPARVIPALALPDAPWLWIVPLGLLAFALVAVRPLRWLTPGGAALALALGVASWLVFGGPGLAALFAPFLVATLLGKLPGGTLHPVRSGRQVAANGLPALAGVALAAAGRPDLGFGAFLGGLACLGADTCATEIGTRYGGTPRSIRTGRPVEPGESGGVTTAGLLASLAGALLAPLAWASFGTFDLAVVGIGAAGGVLGALVDSLLGATVQWRGRDPTSGRTVEAVRVGGVLTERVSGRVWLDNDAVNLLAGIAAALATTALLGARGG